MSTPLVKRDVHLQLCSRSLESESVGGPNWHAILVTDSAPACCLQSKRRAKTGKPGMYRASLGLLYLYYVFCSKVPKARAFHGLGQCLVVPHQKLAYTPTAQKGELS